MKNVFQFAILLLALNGTAFAQSVNQLTILPTHPTPNDTIFIVSDLSYRGNCAFGLVYMYEDMTGSTIRIFPTYCGYWDTTDCNSVDTFKIAPLPIGDYQLAIEYHQGSVCPISNFDATIFNLDTTFTVSPATSVMPDRNSSLSIKIYPNPSSGYLLLESDRFVHSSACQLTVSHLAGGQVFQGLISQNPYKVDVAAWAKGIYLVSVTDENGNLLVAQKVAIE